MINLKMEKMPNLYKVLLKDSERLELSGVVQVVDFLNGSGRESTPVKGKESALKVLAVCDEKGYMNPLGHFTSSVHDTDTLRVTEVLYSDSLGNERKFPFEDYIRWERPETLLRVVTEEFRRPSK